MQEADVLLELINIFLPYINAHFNYDRPSLKELEAFAAYVSPPEDYTRSSNLD